MIIRESASREPLIRYQANDFSRKNVCPKIILKCPIVPFTSQI